jgi:hypothetical protein
MVEAGPEPAAEALAAAAAEALAAAARRGDAAALAALLPPLAPTRPQGVLDAALLAAAGAGWHRDTPDLVEKHDAAAALLLGAGAAADAVAEDGATPLHLAAAWGNVPLIRRLLAAGAKVDARAGRDRYSGTMPHHLAATNGRCEALALLLDAGAQVRGGGGPDGERVRAGGTMGGPLARSSPTARAPRPGRWTRSTVRSGRPCTTAPPPESTATRTRTRWWRWWSCCCNAGRASTPATAMARRRCTARRATGAWRRCGCCSTTAQRSTPATTAAARRS